jgi:hypothetical protein
MRSDSESFVLTESKNNYFTKRGAGGTKKIRGANMGVY